MPFPPKKPDEEKPKAAPGAPAPEEKKPAAPGEAPPSEEAPAEAKPGDKPTDSAPKAEGASAPKSSASSSKPSSGSKGGGTSAPLTPNQGVPDVKPDPEPGVKAEPEGDDEKLPKEGDEAKKPAQEQPKGLPSLAVMTKEEAEKAAKDQNGSKPNAEMTQLITIVEGLAKMIKAQGTTATPMPGGTNTQGAMTAAKTGMMPQANGMMKPMMGKPGMPARPGAPMAGKPGMMAKPGMGGMAGGAGAPGMGPKLTMEQITGLMGIMEAANTGRIPRQGAALLISSLGFDPETAMKMVSPDAAPEEAMGALAGGAENEFGVLSPEEDPDSVMINPEEGLEEEAGEGGEEEFVEEGEEEPVKKKRKVFEQEGPFKADWDEDQPRDENGQWSSTGGAGGGGSDNKEPGTFRGGYYKTATEFSRKGLPGFKTRKEHVGEWKEGVDYDAMRSKEQEWDRAAARAVALGHLDPKVAQEAGWSESGHVDKGHEKLPERMWHVTTAADAVRKEGLKTRAELAQRDGKGLGGGPEDTISFTDDPKIAADIQTSMLEFHDLLNDKTSIKEMFERAEKGSDAKEPYAHHILKTMGAKSIDDVVSDKVRITKWNSSESAPADEEWYDPDAPRLHGITGEVLKDITGSHVKVPADKWRKVEDRYHERNGVRAEKPYETVWERDKTDFEKNAKKAEFFKAYSSWREYSGGRMDPLFFSTDVKGFKNVPRDQIQTLEFRPNKGYDDDGNRTHPMGYRANSLGEIRTYTGDAVKLVTDLDREDAVDDFVASLPERVRERWEAERKRAGMIAAMEAIGVYSIPFRGGSYTIDEMRLDWDEDQPRDEKGRWSSEGGGGGGTDAVDRALTGAGSSAAPKAKSDKPSKGLREVAERAGHALKKEGYVAKAMENLKNTSRTVAGNVDLSASPDKAKAMAGISGAEAKDKAIANYQGVIERLHDERHREFKNPAELREFIEGVAADVNKGIVKEGKLIREHDSDKYPYTKVAELEKYMDKYYKDLHAKLDDPKVDPKDLAAWSEHSLDLEGHFFSDGVGKTSKAVSSYILMRRGHDLPTWPKDRAKIFDNARDGLGQWTKFYHSMFEGSENAQAATAHAEQHKVANLATKAHENGGFTYHPTSGNFASEGFAVSIHPEHEQKWKGKESLNADKVKEYVNGRKEFFEKNPNAHLGGWYNPDDDTWYLDVSHVTNDKKEAVSLGARHNQKGIYDLKEGRTITDREYGEVAAGERGDAERTLRLHEGFLRPAHTVAGRDRRGDETDPRGSSPQGRAPGRLDFNPDQPRDENGRFSDTGGGGGSLSKESGSGGSSKPAVKVGPFEHTEGSKAFKETPEERAIVAKALATSHELANEWQEKLKGHGIKVQMGGSLVSDLALPSDVYDADLKFLYDGPNSKDLIPTIEKETGLKFVKTVNMGGGGHDKVVDAHMIEGFITRNGVTLEVEGALRDGKNYTGWHQHYKNVLTPDELKMVRARKWELTRTPEGRNSKAYKAYKGEVRDEVQRRAIEKGLVRKDALKYDFDPDQPRDENGRWSDTGGGGGGGGGSSKSESSGSSGGGSAPKASRPTPKAGWRGEAAGHKDTLAAFKTKNGWRPDRVKLHKEYAKHAMKDVPKSDAPKVYMTGGGPATGKTVGILNNPDAKIPSRAQAAHINPDDSKEFLPEYKDGKGDEEAASFVHEESSEMAKDATREALAAGHDVVLDTVGDSGIDKLHAKVEKMRAQGAKFIKADYGTVNVDEAVRRAKERAEREGRYVAEPFIRAAHKDVAQTALGALARGTFDEMDFWDTSGKTPVKIASYKKGGGLQVHNNEAWEAFKRRGEGHP